MPLRIAFDLDGVLADMDGALFHQAEIVFGEAMTRRLAEGAVTDTPSNGMAGPRPSSTSEHTASKGGAPGKAAALNDPQTRPAGEKPANDRPDDEPPLSRFQMTTRQQRRLWHHIQSVENFWETLKEIETGSVARLARLAADRRWEVIFLTRRPESAGATAQIQTQRWLHSKGFPLPSVYVVQGSRGRIAAALALDFVIDDTPENCLDVVVDSKARAVLVWREDEKQLPATAKRLGIGVVKTVHECLGILAQVDAPAAERTGMVDRVMRVLGLKETIGG